MDLNVIVLSIAGLIILYFGYTVWNQPVYVIPSIPRLLVPLETGKTHHIQSMRGDASMNTELRRRRVIQAVGRLDPSKLKESRTATGSTTGAIETYMISGIGIYKNKSKLQCPPSDIIFDGGGATDEYCMVLDDDGYGIVYDGGDANTRVCGV